MTPAALCRVLLVLLMAPLAAYAGEPPSTAFLRIEAGGHTSAVPRLAIDAHGTLMASAGYDKTIRLWSLPDGTARAVLRPAIGPQKEGEIYAVAVSPDGRRVFAAGATGGSWDTTFSILIYNADKATLLGLLSGLPSPVNDLAISPDGTRLAAGLAQGGVRVWETGSFHQIFADPAITGPVRSVVLTRDNRMFVAAADGHLRGYDPAGHRIGDVTLASGVRPWGLALSPDSFLLAVTGETADKAGHLHVDVLSTRTLAPLFSPDTTGLTGEGLLTVAWVHDAAGGVQLLAGGYAHDATAFLIRRWQDFGLGGFTDIAAAHDTIRHLVALPAGGAVYATEDPGWGRIDGAGTVTRPPTPPMADLRPSRDRRLAVSADGAVVAFTTPAGVQRFSVTEPSLQPETAPDPALTAARTEAPGLVLSGWKDSSGPRLNGAVVTLEHDEIARSAALLPDGALLGTDTHLRRLGRDGRTQAVADLTAPAWAVTVTPDARLAIAALRDGTLRWYDLAPGRITERAGLFVSADSSRWVLFTPEGFFADSERGGDDLVGLHLNRSRKQQPDWLSFSEAFRLFHVPDIVRARLAGDPAPALARLAALGDIRARLSHRPSVAVVSACQTRADGTCPALSSRAGAGLTVPADAGKVRLTAQIGGADPQDGVADPQDGVADPKDGVLDVFVNDRIAGRFKAAAGTIAVDAPLDPGANLVQLRLYDRDGAIFSQSTPLQVERAAAADSPGVPQGRLFLLAIGIDHFANPDLSLHFAVADAKTFTDGIAAAARPLFRSVEVTQLLEQDATRARILDAFDALAQKVRPEDTFLFYVASHGVVDEDDGHFLLVPQDMTDISSWQAMARQSIDEGVLVESLARIQARDALLFLDTCHAGKVTADSLANVGHETGRYLLTASSSVQEALDSYDNRNGVFVVAVKEALAGRAGSDADHDLGALALGEYVSRRVGQLARQKGHDQDAQFRAAQRDLRSFPVVRVGQ
jgi:WD40 repeat protein